MNNIVIIAPHPDDETLGAGGLILKEKDKGSKVHWIIITSITAEYGWDENLILKRQKEIDLVSSRYNFDSVINLNLPTTRLDTLPILSIVEKIKFEISKIEPDTLIIPHYSDIHTDHQISYQASISCSKWFRFPFIKRCLAYETLSETHWSQSKDFFKPNIFINITEYIDKKIEIMKIYESEIQTFPNPRSEESMRALATFRGSMSGFKAAESFELLLDRS